MGEVICMDLLTSPDEGSAHKRSGVEGATARWRLLRHARTHASNSQVMLMFPTHNDLPETPAASKGPLGPR
jgi:hypothetical protein